jgi:hypothetical protein
MRRSSERIPPVAHRHEPQQTKRGPEFGISLLPMNDSELVLLVADFCAVKWMARTTEHKEPRDSDETASAEPTTTIASTRARSRQMCLLLGFVTKLSAAVNFSSDELSPLTHAPKSVDLRMIQCGLELVTLVGSTASSFMNEIHIFCFRCV